MLQRKSVTMVAFAATTLTALVGCSSGSTQPGSSKTITVAYQKFGAFVQMDQHMTKAKQAYEAAHPGMTVKLVPIQADENSYYTKLNLMSKSASTAPDVLYEDTFLVNSDIDAGYLAPIDGYVSKWSDWSQFTPAAQAAGKGADGKLYGVPMGTDTRALYYNKELFARPACPRHGSRRPGTTSSPRLAPSRTSCPASPRSTSTRGRRRARARPCKAWKCSCTARRTPFTTSRPTSGSSPARD